ncbi:MAG: hypothetical protein ACI4KG_01890 [Oscillospiraceae bacterium]
MALKYAKHGTGSAPDGESTNRTDDPVRRAATPFYVEISIK